MDAQIRKRACTDFGNSADLHIIDEASVISTDRPQVSIFLHEESQICKYGKACERVMCMYRHKDSDSDEDDDEEDENENEQDVQLKPSLEKVKKVVRKSSCFAAAGCSKF